ncbi:MAG: LptF/LptG family permease [Rhodobacterales bacterium]|nr:LptF/LptG family permease [Rhodobacterales bacterium]NCX53987.1 LptF/LptG family permease [Rhodobacterales bacterium]
MTILDKYVLKQCFTSFLFFTIVLSLVAWINAAIELIESLARDGHSVATVVDLIALTIPKILIRVFPISAFAATVFTIIRLSNESELTVMLAAGLRPRQIVKPYFIFGLITTLFALSMSIYLAPQAEKLLSEKKFELSRAYASKFLKVGKFQHPSSGVTLFIRDISTNGELLDVFISDRRDDVFTYNYSAAKAYLLASENKAVFVLTNGVIQIHNADQNLLSLTNFDELTYDLSEAFEKNNEPQIGLGQLPTYLLWSDPIAAMNAADKTLAQVLENFHSRIQNALLCLVATLIGFATLYAADLSRYGTSRFVVLAIFLLANVKIVESAVIDITRSNSSSWPLVYLPTLIGLSIFVVMIMFSEHKWKLKND